MIGRSFHSMAFPSRHVTAHDLKKHPTLLHYIYILVLYRMPSILDHETSELIVVELCL